MFGTRWRKIFRDLWSRKVRTLLVSTSIFIGVLGVVTLFSTGEILINQLEKDLQQDRLAMIRVAVTVNSGTEVDNAAYLAALNDPAVMPGVTTVEGRAIYPLYWKLPDEERFREGNIVAYTAPLDQMQLEPPRMFEGTFPQPGQQQLAIERRMAEKYDLAIGDTLAVRILSQTGSAPSAGPASSQQVQQENWTISGLVFQPYVERGGTGPLEFTTLVFAAYEDAQHIAGFTGLSAIYARFVDFATADASSTAFESAIANNSPYVPVFTTVEDPAENSAIERTRTTNRLLVILALVALVVSGFLVINVINAIVVEQRRQIGVMKSLGATRGDTFLVYTGIALMYGLIGVIPGVLLGIPGGYYAAQGLAAQSDTIIEEFSIAPTGILIGIIVGLAVPFLAAIVPVFNGTRVSIREAMTDVGISTRYGRGLLARLIAAVPMPVTLRQAVNNVNQKKFRLALTGTALTLAVGAFMGIYAVFSSLTGVIDDVFQSIGNEIAVNPSEGQRFESIRVQLASDELQTRLAEKGLPTLRDIEPGGNLAISIEGYEPPPVTGGPPGLFALGINPANPDIAPLDLKAGTAWNDDPNRDGVVISSRIADLMGKTTGDKIVILAGGNRAEFEIIGIASYPFDTVWMRWDTLARLGGLVGGAATPDDYAMGTRYTVLPELDDQVGIWGLNIGPQDQISRFLSFREGRFFTPGANEIIISAELAEKGTFRVGDSLELIMGDQVGNFTITGVFDLPAQLAANPNHPREVIGAYWRDLAVLEGRPLDGEPYPNSIAIILDAEDPSAEVVDDVITEINETLLDNGITAEFTNWVEFNDLITTFVVLFGVILGLAAALIAAVGAVGLLASLSMSVFERQREIGVMRSVGASSYAVAFQFLIEGITIGVAAWAFGVPLSYLISRGLIAALPFEAFGVGYPLITPLIGLAGMLVIVSVASLWPSLGAARKTVSDILRYQ